MKKKLILLGLLLCVVPVFYKTYLVTYEFKQKHYSLNVSDYFKDKKNSVRFQLPTTKEFYDSLEIGDDIFDDFRWGSFIFKGSAGSQSLTVVDKEIRE